MDQSKPVAGNPASTETPAVDEDASLLDVMALMLPPTEWDTLRDQSTTHPAENPNEPTPAQDQPENIDIDDNDLWIEVGSEEPLQEPDPQQEEIAKPPSLPARSDGPRAAAGAEEEQDAPDDYFRLTGPVNESDIAFFTEIFSDLAPRPRMLHVRQVQIMVPGGRKVRFEKLCKKWNIRQATLHNLLIARVVRALENPTDEWLELLNQHRQAVIDRGKLHKRRQKKHLDETLEDADE